MGALVLPQEGCDKAKSQMEGPERKEVPRLLLQQGYAREVQGVPVVRADAEVKLTRSMLQAD
jgi:hypothetical protein